MNIEVNRHYILEAAKIASKVAPSAAYSDVINGILVEGNSDTGELYLTATNHSISIQMKVMATVHESGSMLINARLLADMMSKLDTDFITMSANKPQLLNVIGGRCRYQINCLSSEHYPKPIIPFPEESVIMSGICSLAKRTTFAVSKSDNIPELQCVQVKLKNNAVQAAACDGMRMMLTKDAAGTPDEREFLLPGSSLHLLASISKDDDVFEVGSIGNQVVFVRGDMIFTINKLSTGEFIDINNLLQKVEAVYTAVADAGKLKEAFELLAIGAAIGGKHNPINLAMADGEISMNCNHEYSEASTSVTANVINGTPDTGFHYDVSALVKLFRVVGGTVKIEIDANGFMMIKTRTEVYLQRPMRTPAPIAQDKAKNSSQSEQKDKKKEAKRAKGTKDVKEAA